MALTVEDGSVVAGADTYISTADADTYFENHQRLVDGALSNPWDGLDDEIKEAALRYATQWVDKRYDWNGSMVDPDAQTLSWPRWNAWDSWRGTTLDSNAVEQRIKDAVCEMALNHVGTALYEPLSRGGGVQSIRVGPIAEQYFESASFDTEYDYVDDLLKGLHNGMVGDSSLIVEMERG